MSKTCCGDKSAVLENSREMQISIHDKSHASRIESKLARQEQMRVDQHSLWQWNIVSPVGPKTASGHYNDYDIAKQGICKKAIRVRIVLTPMSGVMPVTVWYPKGSNMFLTPEN